jgi:hypothetical protein
MKYLGFTTAQESLQVSGQRCDAQGVAPGESRGIRVVLNEYRANARGRKGRTCQASATGHDAESSLMFTSREGPSAVNGGGAD